MLKLAATVSTQHRFVVVYRPANDNEPIEYFGPFVSERLADEFVVERLPENSKTLVKPLKPRQDFDNDN